MSLDPRSRERLAALGRTLPQKLPTAKPPTPTSDPQPTPQAGRHRLETEQDPEALFRELITASADGTVPNHLLDRLRELEARQPRDPRTQPGLEGVAGSASSPRSLSAPPVGRTNSQPVQPSRPSQRARSKPPLRRLDPEQQALYNTFEDMLLDEDPDA